MSVSFPSAAVFSPNRKNTIVSPVVGGCCWLSAKFLSGTLSVSLWLHFLFIYETSMWVDLKLYQKMCKYIHRLPIVKINIYIWIRLRVCYRWMHYTKCNPTNFSFSLLPISSVIAPSVNDPKHYVVLVEEVQTQYEGQGCVCDSPIYIYILSKHLSTGIWESFEALPSNQVQFDNKNFWTRLFCQVWDCIALFVIHEFNCGIYLKLYNTCFVFNRWKLFIRRKRRKLFKYLQNTWRTWRYLFQIESYNLI